jgi:glycosyltransferase involved in cell wall biosynthesis
VVVHVHGLASLVPWSPFLSPTAGAEPAAVVATLHGVLDWRARAGTSPRAALWHRALERPLLRRLAGVHGTRPSEVESARGSLAPGVEPECIPWTLPGDDAASGTARAAAAPGASRPPSRPFVLGVGRLHPIKGIERAIAALSRLPAQERPRLLLAGAGSRSYVARLARRADDLGVRGDVEFLGLVGGAALRALYAEARALVLPSRYENFGMVVLEALRAGCPVVASRETPWECLDETGAGRVVDADDREAFAAAIARFADPTGRARAASAGRALFAERFAPDRVIPRFAAWYERCLAGALAPARA